MAPTERLTPCISPEASVDSANKRKRLRYLPWGLVEYIRQHSSRLMTPASPTIWLRMQVLLTLWLIASKVPADSDLCPSLRHGGLGNLRQQA
jgi:hypothetical protein